MPILHRVEGIWKHIPKFSVSRCKPIPNAAIIVVFTPYMTPCSVFQGHLGTPRGLAGAWGERGQSPFCCLLASLGWPRGLPGGQWVTHRPVSPGHGWEDSTPPALETMAGIVLLCSWMLLIAASHLCVCSRHDAQRSVLRFITNVLRFPARLCGSPVLRLQRIVTLFLAIYLDGMTRSVSAFCAYSHL